MSVLSRLILYRCQLYTGVSIKRVSVERGSTVNFHKRNHEMLDLIGINLYLGTDRLLRRRGGRGFSEKCGVTKLYPPPPQKKKLHMKIVPPLVITTPSR